MRCDQPQWLSPEAQFFLQQNRFEAPLPPPCPTCGHVKQEFKPLEVIGKYHGMFNNEYDLRRHLLKDGRHADEFLQITVHSSGPMMYLGLKISDGTEILWEEKDIEGTEEYGKELEKQEAETLREIEEWERNEHVRTSER